eukprot:3936635-Heterocapsa_arctica.AAC.1
MQPFSDSIHNFAVCDNAFMGQVQTLPSSGGYPGLASYAAAASSNPGGLLPPPLTDVGKLQPIAAK